MLHAPYLEMSDRDQMSSTFTETDVPRGFWYVQVEYSAWRFSFLKIKPNVEFNRGFILSFSTVRDPGNEVARRFPSVSTVIVHHRP